MGHGQPLSTRSPLMGRSLPLLKTFLHQRKLIFSVPFFEFVDRPQNPSAKKPLCKKVTETRNFAPVDGRGSGLADRIVAMARAL